MQGLNRLVQDMVRQKKLSPLKQRELSALREFIDRVSGQWFTPAEEVERLEKRFGVQPDIITWGDYYQVHLTAANWEKSDIEFIEILQGFHFDVLQAIRMIAPLSGSEVAELRFAKVAAEIKPRVEMSPADEEAIYLGNLVHLFEDMRLKAENMTAQDDQFFRSFLSEKAVS